MSKHSDNSMEETVAVKLYSISQNITLDNLVDKKVRYEILENYPICEGNEAFEIYQDLKNSISEITLTEVQPDSYKSVMSPEYNPHFFVEIFIKTNDSTLFTDCDKKYNLYIDTTSGRFHIISFEEKNKVMISQITEDRNLSNKMLEKIQQILSVKKTTDTYSETLVNISNISEITDTIVASVISSGKVSSVYLLDPLNKEKKEKLQGYSIIEQSSDLSKAKQKKIRSLLVSTDAYKISNVVVNATFLPDAAISIDNKESSIDFLYSFYSDFMKVFCGGNEYTLNISPSRIDWLSIFIEIFPNDEFIKKYQNE